MSNGNFSIQLRRPKQFNARLRDGVISVLVSRSGISSSSISSIEWTKYEGKEIRCMNSVSTMLFWLIWNSISNEMSQASDETVDCTEDVLDNKCILSSITLNGSKIE